jgi:hypothetical protein
MLMVIRKSKESICLETADKFQIWQAVLTYDQFKISSFSVNRQSATYQKTTKYKNVIVSKSIK